MSKRVMALNGTILKKFAGVPLSYARGVESERVLEM
jgi:hypothetical protein